MSCSTVPAPPTTATPQSFLQCLSYFLTPQAWKQAQQAVPQRHAWRWQTQPLLVVLLVMTWSTGDSLPERFETARAFYVALHQRRRRPGKTCEGFEKALGQLPMPVLRAVADAVRHRLTQVFAERFQVGGFVPLGCDGSRLACPRTRELEQRLRRRKKKNKTTQPETPQIWVTAVVHLSLGLLWSWRLGQGTASEREHLRHLVASMPRRTLLVADAGYVGYELLAALQAAGLSFLIRVSSRAPLWTPGRVAVNGFREGLVYYWPKAVQNKEGPPLRVRLLRVGRRKASVWLVSNVLESEQLPRATASQFYRWRWRNEGLFRSYKRTLGKVKLLSRTVAQVHREAEGSLLATQLLLAQGALALQTTSRVPVVLPSVRKVLLEIRGEIRNIVGMYLGPRQCRSYRERLGQARWRKRRQHSSQVRRRWPGRKDHRPPKRPQIRRMGTILKDKLEKTLTLEKAGDC
jgi:Transposase DDE domain